MKKIITLFCALSILFGVSAQKRLYDFKVKDQNGETVELSNYKGNYILIVNTATECGFTPQYEGLENMYRKFHNDGFVILDFPCNQFGSQAPGTDDEIHSFCTSKYDITFPQFAKIDVNGPNENPLFKWLKSQKEFEGFDLNNPIGKKLHEYFMKQNPDYAKNPDIKWNFTKFLIDKEGNVIRRYEPTTDINIIMDDIYELMHN